MMLGFRPREHVVPGTLAVRPTLDAASDAATVAVSYCFLIGTGRTGIACPCSSIRPETRQSCL